MHIAKTAGTSIVQFFRDRMSAESVLSHGDFLELPGTPAERVEEMQQFEFLSGHFGYSDVETLLDDSYSFTFVRDPIDRVLSLYRFLMWPHAIKSLSTARIAAELGLEGFLTSTLPEVSQVLDNQQTWQLAHSYWREDRDAMEHIPGDELLGMATDHLQKFDLVGSTETFDDDFGEVLSHLDIHQPVPKTRQFKSRKVDIQTDLSPDIVATLKDRMALDYALVEHVDSLRNGSI